MGDTKVVVFDSGLFNVHARAPNLFAKSARAAVHDAVGKLKGSQLAKKTDVRKGYVALVQLAISDGELAPEEVEMCQLYRQRHGISEKEHEAIVKNLGWKKPFTNTFLVREVL